jgi:hypothetical protein
MPPLHPFAYTATTRRMLAVTHTIDSWTNWKKKEFLDFKRFEDDPISSNSTQVSRTSCFIDFLFQLPHYLQE